MADKVRRECPGCGLQMPPSEKARYDGYFNSSPECWVIFEEVLAVSFSNPKTHGPVHQIIVDAYAVQHAGGKHPDKSVDIHLVGLHAAFSIGMEPGRVPDMLRRLADAVREWPHFERPEFSSPLTILDVAVAETAADHLQRAETWARAVWESWAEQHDAVARFLADSGF
jgi:Family of unknown function (DUF5946)